MRTLIYCFILTYVSLLNWEVFNSVEGNFSILAPANLEENIQVIPSDLGQIEYVTYSCHFKDPSFSNFAYVISYATYPDGMIPADSVHILDDFLNNSMEASAESLKGQIVYVESASQQSVNGLIGRIEYDEGQAVMKTKVFFKDNRYYSLQVFSAAAKSLNNDIDKFLESFKFLD